MYISSCNKNNEGIQMISHTSIQPSRSTSRPPIIGRYNNKNQDGSLDASDYTPMRISVPRPQKSSYVQQSRQMHSDIIKSSIENRPSGGLTRDDKEFFNTGIVSNTKGGHIMPKKLQTQRSRVLRPLAAGSQNNAQIKGSVERNWTQLAMSKDNYSAQIEPIDMELFFQVEPALHTRKRLNQTTPKIGMKAILPDIFQKQLLGQTNFVTNSTEVKSNMVDGSHETNTATSGNNFSHLTPGDDQNLNDSNISQTVVKNSSTSKNQNTKQQTERLEGGGSRTREKSQQKIPQIKVRPLSSTKRVFNLGESQSSVDKSRIALNIVRSSSTLLQIDAKASESTASHTNATIIPQSETSELMNSRPPKDKKKTTRAQSKGLCGLPLTSLKNKRMSINAPSIPQPREDSANRKSFIQPIDNNQNSQQIIKCGLQDRRFLDLLLWQTLPQTPNSSVLATLTSLWNYLSNQHFALRPLDLDTTKSLLKAEHSQQDFPQLFKELCGKKWVKSIIREVSSHINEVIQGMRYGNGSKSYVMDRSVIVGYDIRGLQDEGKTEISIDECDIYLLVIAIKQEMNVVQAFETIKWDKKQPIYELSISLDSK